MLHAIAADQQKPAVLVKFKVFADCQALAASATRSVVEGAQHDDQQDQYRNDAKRNEMARNGRVQARKFSWQKTARETLKLYNG